MKLDEPVTIHPFNPEWHDHFERERRSLKMALGPTIVDIQHIGSTAIRGVWAKPIIDILAGLALYPANKESIETLEREGYEYLGESGVMGRQYLRKREDKSYNLHLVEYVGELWLDNLLFRDYLRAHSGEAAEYSRHKRELIANGVNNLLEYSERKAAFISRILERARKCN